MMKYNRDVFMLGFIVSRETIYDADDGGAKRIAGDMAVSRETYCTNS